MLGPFHVAVRIAGLLFALVAAITVTASAASADPLTWAPAAPILAPADADPADPGVHLNAVSCTGPGSCTAVGSYEDRTGVRRGLLVSEFAGSWQQGLPAKLPNAPNADPEASITSVTCQSDGNCTAIGSYIDSHGGTEGVIETENGGTWGVPVEVADPGVPSVAGLPNVSLDSISCVTSGDCLAVGTYLDSRNDPEGLLETETNGQWAVASQTATGDLPGNAAVELPASAGQPTLAVQLPSVSCAPGGSCTIGGSYIDDGGQRQALLIAASPPSSGTAWSFSGSEVTLPANVGSTAAAELVSVSCGAVGSCVAVGDYNASAGGEQGLLVEQADGSWGPGSAAPLPGGSGSHGARLTAVSCATAGDCAAVGNYSDSDGNVQGLLQTEIDGAWDPPLAATLPADGGSTPFVTLTGVSCAGSGCAATGDYSDDSFVNRPLLLSEFAGDGWSAGVEPALPGVSGEPNAADEAVSCARDAGCGAIGNYTDAAGRTVADAVNGTSAAPATPTLSLRPVPARVAPGASITPSATLSGGSDETGTITFRLFGPESSPPAACEVGGTVVGAATVSGDGTYTSDGPGSLSAPGDYWWYAEYGGDLANAPVASTCGTALAETVIPAPPGPPATTPPTPTPPAPAPTPQPPPPAPANHAPVPPHPRARLFATIVSTRSVGDRVTVTIACHGPAGRKCAVKLALSAATHAPQRAARPARVQLRAQATAHALVIAHASASIRTGHRRAVALTLGRSGRKLLQTRRHLIAHLKLTEPGVATARTTTVRLAAAARHRPHPAKRKRR